MKECRYTVCKPVYETKEVEQKQTICKPVWEEKVVKVCAGEWQTRQECVPGRRRHKLVWDNGGCDGCSNGSCGNSCGSGCGDPCGGGGTCRRHGCLRFVTCEEPSRMVCKKVWVPREECRTVKVCKMVPETVCKKVPVTTCRMVKQECVKMVPTTVCEKVPVCVMEKVCKRVKECVPVCECERPSCWDKLRGLFHRDDCCQTSCYNGTPGCHGGTAPVMSGPAHAAPATPAAEPLKMPKPKE
jgi:hypothetical protein